MASGPRGGRRGGRGRGRSWGRIQLRELSHTFSSEIRAIAMGMSLALTAACIIVKLKTWRCAQLPPSLWRS